ncbi:MAG: hypothetical protein QM754_04795 [Tepidisphaeraceae bacterium]
MRAWRFGVVMGVLAVGVAMLAEWSAASRYAGAPLRLEAPPETFAIMHSVAAEAADAESAEVPIVAPAPTTQAAHASVDCPD